jgi:hypothetical protein
MEVSVERTPTDPRDSSGVVLVSDEHTMINDVMTLEKDTIDFVLG